MKASARQKNLEARQKAFEGMGKSKMVGGRMVGGSVNSGAFHRPGSVKK